MANINHEYVPEISTPKQSIYDYSKDVTLQIKEEQLNIAKKWIQTLNVNIYRETFTEEKSFNVPVTREELVIEKKNPSPISEHMDVPIEVIRIPLSEERVEFTKHRIALEDVSVYKQQIEEIKHIEETLKKERVKVKIFGCPKVRDESNSKP